MTANNRQSNKHKYITMFETETAVIKILIVVTRAANLGVFFLQGLRLNGGDPMLGLRTFFRPLLIGRLHPTIVTCGLRSPPLFSPVFGRYSPFLNSEYFLQCYLSKRSPSHRNQNNLELYRRHKQGQAPPLRVQGMRVRFKQEVQQMPAKAQETHESLLLSNTSTGTVFPSRQ